MSKFLFSWEEHYHGPHFCDDLTWAFAAEAAACQAGLKDPYIETLVKRVCPNWNQLKTSREVLEFWYRLAHADSAERVRSLAEAIRWPKELPDIVEKALQLAEPICGAAGEERTAAAQPFIEFVKGLSPQQADELLAVMYLGRGDSATFSQMLQIVAGSAFNQTALARQMAGKTPLIQYLRDGLAKWRAEQGS